MWSKLCSNFQGVARRKGMWEIQDSLGFFIPRRGFRISDTKFQSLSVELGFRIPKPRILDSTSKKFPFHEAKDTLADAAKLNSPGLDEKPLMIMFTNTFSGYPQMMIKLLFV